MSLSRATVSFSAILALSVLSVAPHVFAATATGNGGTPGTCYNQATPVPAPGSRDLTYPICTNGVLAAPTPIAYPTNTAGVPYVQPTNVPTIGVTVQNTPGVICISGCSGATPIAYPTAAVGGYLLVAPTALPTLSVILTSPTFMPTPVPYPTAAVGSYLVVAPTALPTISVSIAGQSLTPLVVSTAPPDNRNSAGGTQTINCDKSVVVSISTATTTALVAVSGSTSVYVCAYDISLHSGTNPAFQFEYGSGTACATSPVALTGTFGGANASANQDFKNGSGTGMLFSGIASNGLCLVSTGTTPNLQGVVTYAQF
jgi:hypothetical protein